MSLSSPTPAFSAQSGHARKIASIHFPESSDSLIDRREAVTRLRDFFALRADVLPQDRLVSSIERFMENDGTETENTAIVQGALTRTHRKAARRLGFDVRHRGLYAPVL